MGLESGLIIVKCKERSCVFPAILDGYCRVHRHFTLPDLDIFKVYVEDVSQNYKYVSNSKPLYSANGFRFFNPEEDIRDAKKWNKENPDRKRKNDLNFWKRKMEDPEAKAAYLARKRELYALRKVAKCLEESHSLPS